MKRSQKNTWKSLPWMLAGGYLLMAALSAEADIGTVKWQQKYNNDPDGADWSTTTGLFYSVGFNADGSVLATGYRQEPDSGSAIGVRYNADTGAVLDSPPEWFLFEHTWQDYAHDRFNDQHIDSSGNVYFVGMGYDSGWNNSSSRYNVPNIWKYSSSYNNPSNNIPDRPLWRNYYTVHGNTTDDNGLYENMAVDSADNIIAVGRFNKLASANSNRDWIIDKYDSNGNRAAGFPLTHDKDSLHDYAYDVATDSEDNFIVVGSVTENATTDHHNWVVRKYQNDGTLSWETEYDFAGGHDQALYVSVDSEDNIIVSGYRRNLPADHNDWYIVKYAKEGDGSGGPDILWEQSWDDGASKHGNAYETAVDDKNNFYVIGVEQLSSVIPAYTDRYRPILQYRNGETGALLKSQNIVLDPTENNLPNAESDILRRLVLDDDRLLLAGYTQQDGDYTVKLGKTGRVLMMEIAFDCSYFIGPSHDGGMTVYCL